MNIPKNSGKERIMTVANAKQTIHERVMEWAGVTSEPHRFGGTAWYVGKREIGHIHGDALVDIAFPPEVRDEVVAAGRAEPHHIYPKIGISLYLNTPEDVDEAVALLRRSYDLIRNRKQRA